MLPLDPETEPLPVLVDRYRGDLNEYARDCLVIRTKAAALIPFDANFAQRYVHALFSRQMRETGRVRGLILKARQEGISTYVAGRFFRRVTLYDNQLAMVIADQRKRGQELFAIYELFDRKLPPWIAPEKRWQRSGTRLHYDNPHGTGLNSRLIVETAMDATAGRGVTIQAVHASELGFWENPEETWTALMQAVPDDGSEVIVESTANGVGNLFHTMWTDAEAGDSSFLPIFLPWWIHAEYRRLLSPEQAEDLLGDLTEWEQHAHADGLDWVDPDELVPPELASGARFEGGRWKLSLEQLAWRRSAIKDKLNNDENLFRQEYPATAREAFLVSGNCFFDEDALLDYEARVSKPERFTIKWKKPRAIRKPKPKGELRVWRKPEPEGEYVIFVDTATGKLSGERESIYAAEREQGGRDFSCAWVYEVRSQKYVACLHGRIPPETFADKCFALGYYYAHLNRRTGNRIPALMGVERNHYSGETVVRRLKDDLEYPNLFIDRQLNRRLNRMTPAYGWITTEAKRTIMLDEFSAEIRARTVELPDADTIRECFTFTRDEDGKVAAQENCHDDRVIAAAGCIQMARHHRVPAVPSRRRLVRRGGPVGTLVEEEEPR